MKKISTKKKFALCLSLVMAFCQLNYNTYAYGTSDKKNDSSSGQTTAVSKVVKHSSKKDKSKFSKPHKKAPLPQEVKIEKQPEAPISDVAPSDCSEKSDCKTSEESIDNISKKIVGNKVIANFKIGKEDFSLTTSSVKNWASRAHAVFRNLYHRAEKINGKVIIMDCSLYNSIFAKDGYEAHHLISQRFCKLHGIDPRLIPCVLIPKEVHQKTGSYGRSEKSKEYFELEEKKYKESGGELCDVLMIGIEDLERAIKECHTESLSGLDPTLTPIKKSIAYVKCYDIILDAQKNKSNSCSEIPNDIEEKLKNISCPCTPGTFTKLTSSAKREIANSDVKEIF